MNRPYKPQLFNSTEHVAQGWYWLMRGRDLRRGQVKAAEVGGYEVVVFRGKDGVARALHAYCPHMGAHLGDGRVEGNALRCFFHHWRFDGAGQCTDVPCLDARLSQRISTPSYRLKEAYGLIWLWLGTEDVDAEALFPYVPALRDDCDFAVGKRFKKGCHPNVVMINAIDEQHFHSVHHIPNHLFAMKPIVVAPHHIAFENRGGMPKRGLFGWLLPKLYKAGFVTYRLDYFHGHVGVVTLGPDFLQAWLMFALRPTKDGRCEGYTLVFTKKRRGVMGAVLNPILLQVQKWVSDYFAHGDTKVFETIRFELKHPVAADAAVVAFMDHMEHQPRVPIRRSLCGN